MSLDLGGPVSMVLEADVRAFVQRHGVVVWLDVHDVFTPFVDRLRGARAGGSLPYEVLALRGSYLELILSLERVADGTERTPLVLHLPGLTEETVKGTPALELYLAGARYRKALPTLVTDAAAGKVNPDRIAAFLEQGAPTLEAANRWLQDELEAAAGGLSVQLRAMTPQALLDDLLSRGFVAGRLGQPADLAAVWRQFGVWTGLPQAWRDALPQGASPRAEDVAFAAASWALGVEYVGDLARAPVSPLLQPARSLPAAVQQACRDLAQHLRDRKDDVYLRTADDTEALLADEVEAARAQDLGKVDTFRFEEERVLKEALVVLGAGDWNAAASWAALRLDGRSFWLKQDPSRRSAWQLVQAAARLGQAIAAAGPRLDAPSGLDAALERYREVGAAVDRAHRHLEQGRVTLLYPQLPEFETLRVRLDGLRGVWRAWADAWARDFNAACREHGFLPPAACQQRTLFDEVVRPLAQEAGTTALFVVDALRYEMAEELHEALRDTPAATVELKARLAELPTVTEVGMNVLAPVVENGRLRPALVDGKVLGFTTNEFRVDDPASRRKAMQGRVGGGTCPGLTLDEVVHGRDATSLRRAIARAKLVVVHSRELDDAGEKGMGPAMFDNVMQKLRAGWRLLREAGVRRFVFTSDHGFLLIDDAAPGQPHGRKIETPRRHVFSMVAADHRDEVRVALADLGYDEVDGHLMFPESTAVFDAARRPTGFVHGGNSLQERVIPALTVVHRAEAGGSAQSYELTLDVLEGVAGLHRLRVALSAASTEMWSGAREVELALRAPGRADVVVELVQVQSPAELRRGGIAAPVGAPFEVLFRLTGATDDRVPVEVHHPSREEAVIAVCTDIRFAVTATRAAVVAPATPTPGKKAASTRPADDWLEQFADEGVRKVFKHLSAHGAVTETEAASMLGGQRKLRRFALEFEELARKAPFVVRIDAVAGVKRYYREGAAS